MSHELRLPGPLGRLQDAITGPAGQPAVKAPGTVQGGFGPVPAAPIDTTRDVPAPRPMNARDAERLMQAEMLDAMRSLAASSTEISGRLGRRGAINSVIEIWGGVIPAGGTITRSWEVPIGSVRITNHGVAANVLTIQSGVAAGDTGAQTAGVGVNYCAGQATHSMAIGDRGITITGTAGDRVSLQAFAGLQAFGVGAL